MTLKNKIKELKYDNWFYTIDIKQFVHIKPGSHDSCV